MQCLPPGHSRNWYAFLRVLVKLAPHDETMNNEATNVTLKLWPKGINEAVLRGGKMVCYSPIMVVQLIGKRGVALDAKHCVLTTFENPTLAFDMLRTFSDAARATARRLGRPPKALPTVPRRLLLFNDVPKGALEATQTRMQGDVIYSQLRSSKEAAKEAVGSVCLPAVKEQSRLMHRLHHGWIVLRSWHQSRPSWKAPSSVCACPYGRTIQRRRMSSAARVLVGVCH